MRVFRRGLFAAVFLAVGMNAWAEPYLAAWKGVNCNACHVNQTGGYLRNDFGKNYGNSLQTFDWQGIADAAQKIQHSTPMWVSTGLDIHQSYTATFWPNSYSNKNSFYQSGFGGVPPEHSDFSIQAKANEVVSGVFTYRIDEGKVGEFYGLVSGMPEGAYLKFGSFLLPYGLGLADDNSLLRYPLNNLFSFDSSADQNGLEAGIFPDPFFLNVALVNGAAAIGTATTPDYDEKIFSATGGASFSEFTLGGSLHGENLDLESRLLLYGAYGWGRLGPAVILAEYDRGYQGEGGSAPGPVISQTNYQAYHVSAEFDLGSDVYLRLANEWLNDSMLTNSSDGFRDVVSLRCYPVRNFKAQIDLIRIDPVTTVDNPTYAVVADAFMFY
jgi:hypothetical protein